MTSKEYLQHLFQQGLAACSPSQVLEDTLQLDQKMLTIQNQQLDLTDRPVYLLAVGKAAIPMMETTLRILQKHVKKSLVITPEDEASISFDIDELVIGSHPTPDDHSMEAGKRAVRFMQNIPKDAICITLISGGTSSLMCLPVSDISIQDLNKTYDLLNNSGATIHQINTIRKCCSKIKGGQLLNFLNPNVTIVDLVISDVPNDDLSVIGSGPTISDHISFGEAGKILQQLELMEKLPKTVRNYIETGISVGKEIGGTDPLFDHYSYVISSAEKLAHKIGELAHTNNIGSWVARAPFNKDVESVATMIVDQIMNSSSDDGSKLFIFYGESTVIVKGEGKGGRNQELALRGAIKIQAQRNITWLSAGTDGIDGPTDAAGAIVDEATITEARQRDIDPQEFLSENDSYNFHQKMDTLLKTGATGNNLMDLVLVLVQ